MKFNRLLPILLFVLAFPLVALAVAPEDPYYKNWAQCQVGSSVDLTGTSVSPSEGNSSFKQTITLKEVKTDHLVIHISRVEGSKRTDKSKKIGRFISEKSKLKDLGQEEITLAGKKFKCHKYKLTHVYDDGKEMIVFTYWFHPDIPGAAKILGQASDAAGETIDTTTQTAVRWQKK